MSAVTTAEQLGRRAFVMMGARNIVTDEDTLRFDVGTNSRKVSHITVTYNLGEDLYDVCFYTGAAQTVRLDLRSGEFKTRGGRKVLSSVFGVFADQLRSVIESGTGMYLSL